MKRINYLLIVLSLLSVMACAGNDKITSDNQRIAGFQPPIHIGSF